MNKFWVIVGQVYKKNVKSVGFLTMMLAPIIMLAVVGAVIYFVSDIESAIPEIAVITESDEIAQTLQMEEEYFEVNDSIQTVEAAEEAMKNEELAGYLTVENLNGTIQANYTYVVDSESLDMTYLSNLLSNIQLSQRSSELGIAPEDVQSLLTPALVQTNSITIEQGEIVTGDNFNYGMKLAAAYAICIAIFIFIMTYSGIIAEEIASEKGTRIMEVLLSSVSSTTHFFGKLTAIFLICLTQVLVYVAIIAVALQLNIVKELLPEGLNIVETLSGVVGTSLYFFIMGIFLYAVIAAFLGSLVTKIEDVSKAVTPIIFIAMTGFYGGMFALVNTTHPIIKIGSHIPLWTPFIMPFRVAAETATVMEVTISMVVMLAFTLFITFISLVLYRSNVLIYSDAGMFKTIRTSWRNIKNERRSVKKA